MHATDACYWGFKVIHEYGGQQTVNQEAIGDSKNSQMS